MAGRLVLQLRDRDPRRTWIRDIEALREEVIKMCVLCDVNAAAKAQDWKEVKRLATEADKGKHDDELPAAVEPALPVPDDVREDEPAKKSSRSSSKKD